MSIISKISRERLDKKIAPYASKAKTLEVGSYGRPGNASGFPNRIGIDIREGIGVDRVADVYSLPFKDGEFEIVLCLGILEHLENPPRAIAEMRRVLAPGGRIIVSVPFLFPIHDAPNDFWRFTKYGLRVLFSKGWEIEELCAEADFNESLATLLQRVGYQTKFYFNSLLKSFVFFLAWTIRHAPAATTHIYGDIRKSREEPEAFANAFFLAAKKK